MQGWVDFLQKLDLSFGKPTIDKWVRPLVIEKFDAGNLHLLAKDSFQALWFEEHVLPIAGKTFKNNNNRIIKIHLKVGSAATEATKSSTPVAPVPIASPLEESVRFEFDPLEEHCTFAQFIPGKENIVPYRVLCKLCGLDDEGKNNSSKTEELGLFNPIYIYGPKGSGKTHLLIATAKELLNQNLKVIFVKAATFTQHVVSAIRKSKMQDFRAHYRHVDVLIIDDVQEFHSKGATQEELFHTFNTLHTLNKQIILSSTVAPQFLEEIEQRLISRFEWGITLPLQRISNSQELYELLLRRSKYFKFPMQSDLKSFIATRFPSARSISEAIESLVLHSHLQKTKLQHPLSLAQAEHYLKSLVEQEAKETLTAEKIVQIIADIFGIRADDILSKSQSRECVFPRQLAMYLMREELKMPYMKIGRFFSRDHSTVITSIKQIQKGLEIKDSEASCYLGDIQRQILNYH